MMHVAEISMSQGSEIMQLILDKLTIPSDEPRVLRRAS